MESGSRDRTPVGTLEFDSHRLFIYCFKRLKIFEDAGIAVVRTGIDVDPKGVLYIGRRDWPLGSFPRATFPNA